jgi:hypothetical protein
MPWAEGDPVLFGGREQIRADPGGEVVEGGDRGDRHDGLGDPQLLQRNVGQADGSPPGRDGARLRAAA